MNKSNCERIHAKNRFLERFGFDVSEEEYNRIRNVIKNNLGNKYDDIKILASEKQSCHKTAFLLKYKEVELAIIYDRTRKTIVTALNKDMIPKFKLFYGKTAQITN